MRLVVAISGASGAILGIRALERLRDRDDVETHLVLSPWARRTIEHETDRTVAEVRELADVTYPSGNMAARISSGSFLTDGMLIVPCSMRTLAAIATGITDSLITRAADVTLKERRRLVIVPRESPLHEIHLENMLKLARMGVAVVPPVPAFYARPQSLDEMVDHLVVRALDQLGLHAQHDARWDGELHRPEP